MKLSPRGLEAIQALSEEFDTYFWNNDPPELERAVQRLKSIVHSNAKAKEKVFGAYIQTRLEGLKQKGFDLERFKTLLNELG